MVPFRKNRKDGVIVSSRPELGGWLRLVLSSVIQVIYLGPRVLVSSGVIVVNSYSDYSEQLVVMQ